MTVSPILITTTNSPAYSIYAWWGPRAETPEVIAARFLACVDRLKRVHPAYDNWTFILNRKPKKFDALRSDLPAAVAANVVRGDDGEPTPVYGYRASVLNNTKAPGPRSLSVSVKASALAPPDAFCNSAEIETGYNVFPDPSIIAYPAFKAALLALVQSFDATYCSAYPAQMMNVWDESRHLRLAWMSYVSPRFAPLIEPPPSAIVERTAQGGLLMAATEETFSVDNPVHLAVARDILKSLAPFEALPWPPDAPRNT
jgi:hypothetical protein